jgi:hypothetical protein
VEARVVVVTGAVVGTTAAGIVVDTGLNVAVVDVVLASGAGAPVAAGVPASDPLVATLDADPAPAWVGVTTDPGEDDGAGVGEVITGGASSPVAELSSVVLVPSSSVEADVVGADGVLPPEEPPAEGAPLLELARAASSLVPSSSEVDVGVREPPVVEDTEVGTLPPSVRSSDSEDPS